jgi:hypothetical protein
MSPDEIRLKAHERRQKARIEALFAIATGLLLCALFARTFLRAEELLPRMGWGLLSLWGIYFAYQAYKWIWPARLARGATAGESLEYYRNELERRHKYSAHIWRRAGLTFCFLGLAMVIVPVLIQSVKTPGVLLGLLPFFALLIVWLTTFLFLRKRNQEKLLKELDEIRGWDASRS